MNGPPPFPQPARQGRNGPEFRTSDIDNWIVAGSNDWAMLSGRAAHQNPNTGSNEGIYIMSDVSEAYDKANATISDARERYNKVIKDFRGELKNDVVSVGASAEKLLKELSRLSQAFEQVSTLMNSDDMKVAIANAERLVAAFNALSEVNGHKLTFAVMSGNKG